MRDYPAFMEYAASMLADRRFKRLTAAERGVLYSLRLEYWVNGAVPASGLDLPAILGLTSDDATRGYTDRVKAFFTLDAGHMTPPDLADYRQKLDAKRAAQAAGAKATNEKREKAAKTQKKRDEKPQSRKPLKPESHEPQGDGANRIANRDAYRNASGTVLNSIQPQINPNSNPSLERSFKGNPYERSMEFITGVETPF